jgi:hypothetical protein
VKRRAAARYTRTLVTCKIWLKQRPKTLFFLCFFKIQLAYFISFGRRGVRDHNPHNPGLTPMVRAQFSLSHHRHARSVPRDGLSRACLMFACTQRACGATQSRAPRHGLLASPALLVSATKNPLSVVVCVCLFCHGWPSGPRGPHGHVRASPAPNAARALFILPSSLLARP